MADVHNQATRSRNMSAIKASNTKPEIWLRKKLHARGFRYRLNAKDLPGRPDLVFPRYKAVIFINGCFWHAHEGCHLFKIPSTRQDFWIQKLSSNRERDLKKTEELLEQGWRVLTVWECTMKGKTRLPKDELVDRVCQWINQGGHCTSIPE